MTVAITRECNDCREKKLLNEFHKKPTGKYGRMAVCASCVNAKRRGKAENRRDVSIKVSYKVRARLNEEAERLEVPTGWLTNCLLSAALYQLKEGNVEIPAPPIKRRRLSGE